MALTEYETALACRRRGDDAESIEECLQVIRDLRHAYSAS